MNIIDRYVGEVGKHLPRKNRTDIETELRSTLEDMLEDRSQQTGRPADEALAYELLQEYGAPRQVAATYQTHPYLIGPQMFPLYTLILKIVLFSATLGLSIAAFISVIVSNSPDILRELGEFAAGLLNALVAAFGYVTLTFAILERTISVSEFEDKEEWTPAELTKEPAPNQVKVSDRIASIVFTVAALVLLNFYPQVVGIGFLQDGSWTQIGSLSEAFFRYLPWINLSGILTIALDLWLLREGAWRPLTYWLHIALQVVGVAIAALMLSGPSLVTFTPGAVNPELGNLLTAIFTRLVPAILIVVIIVSIIEILKDILRMLRPGKGCLPF